MLKLNRLANAKVMLWISLLGMLFLISSCVIVSSPPVEFSVTYKASKGFDSDSAKIQFANAAGTIVNGSFTGNSFNQVVTVGVSKSAELRASDIFGEIDLEMIVERKSDNTVLFQQTKKCTTTTTNCAITFTTPAK